MTNTGAQAFLDGVAEHLLEPPAQLVPHHAAPRGHGAADRQLRRVGAPPARHARPPGRGDPRPPPARPARRGVELPERRRASAARGARAARRRPSSCRCGCGSATRRRQSWFSTNTSIGTPVDITLEELHVELFHPADEATAAHGRRPHGLTIGCRIGRIGRPRPRRIARVGDSLMEHRSRRPRPTRRRPRSPPRSRRCGRGRSSPADATPTAGPPVWRFSGRWWSQPIPLRRARPWV